MKIVIAKDMMLPATRYGGTERVMWALGKELVRLGHEVTFLVRRGSSCPFARVIEIDPSRNLECQIPPDADIVHFNDRRTAETTKPNLITINGNMVAEDEVPENAVFVSANHARRHGCDSFVYNGLDWDEYGDANLQLPRRHYHFLGKAAWRVKNVRGAIRIARNIGSDLEVLGGYRLNLTMGFRLTLSPHIHFRGMVDNLAKQHYIERSRGLLFPVLWDEPFGLCLTESLYYGAPVFGTTRGSLPEIVTPEVGFLADDEQVLTDHLLSNPDYSPRQCHNYAVDRFNSRLMAKEYLKKYEQVLNGESLVKKQNTLPQ